MSGTKGRSAPSAEEVIEELTKDLEAEYITGQNEESSKPENTEEAHPEPTKSIEDEDIDEEHLKELEITLSEEEKQSRRKVTLDHKIIGNQEFKENKYIESIGTYTLALQICPLSFTEDRSILYANRAASKAKLERKESAIEDCTKAIELNDKYVKAYARRAKLYEETNKLDESLADYKKILELDNGHKEAHEAQYRLPPLINERNEKLKTEMLDKLKDLGNMILRPFGLSTNNFQMNQDPNSGGYSVNFTQTPQ